MLIHVEHALFYLSRSKESVLSIDGLRYDNTVFLGLLFVFPCRLCLVAVMCQGEHMLVCQFRSIA